MLSPRAIISLTWRSISAGGACGSMRVRSSEGLVAASAGKSHSWLTPKTESPKPMAYAISVAEGNNEQIRIRTSDRVWISGPHSGRPGPRRFGQQVGKHKPIAFDDLAQRQRNRASKHGTCAGERMKLA